MSRIYSIAGALLLLAATATTAAAAGDITGIVKHVDPVGNIVYLNDGRTVYLVPGAIISLEGRQANIEQIVPGMRIVVAAAPDARRAPPADTRTAQPVAVAPFSHRPIDASGTVARFDAQTDMITFQDGRMVKLGPQSSVWQQEQRLEVQPGERVLVRNAQPAGFRTAWDSTTMPRHRMGTVVNVDPASALVILSDGTVVRVSQATRVQMEGQPLTLSQLRPGDELVIVGTPRTAGTSADAPGMAMPGQRATIRPSSMITFDATDVHLMRRPQAP